MFYKTIVHCVNHIDLFILFTFGCYYFSPSLFILLITYCFILIVWSFSTTPPSPSRIEWANLFRQLIPRRIREFRIEKVQGVANVFLVFFKHMIVKVSFKPPRRLTLKSKTNN
uniref:Uncharacterized protein n=1 Tax=Cacopsylla melanoneura TaxID=428564 RepID=A0A8D8TEK0_9HEMI